MGDLRPITGESTVKNTGNQTKRTLSRGFFHFFVNTTRYPWADFRSTKAGIKLHLKLCFIDKEHLYPDQFEVTNAVEHDDNHLEVFVNQPEATYIFDRAILITSDWTRRKLTVTFSSQE
ncbi:hypothetical protein LQF66_11215 [Tetragenococcus halophilus]|nr:hypothetical protein [Tetragenococcus halophilus]